MADPVNGTNGAAALARSSWGPAGASAGGVAVLLGSLGMMANESYSHDQEQGDARLSAAVERIEYLEQARVEEAKFRGAIEERISKALEALIDQDIDLQGEMRALDSALEVRLDGLNKGLQEEITRSAEERRFQLEALRQELGAVRVLSQNAWTRDEQEGFEAQMGLTLERTAP